MPEKSLAFTASGTALAGKNKKGKKKNNTPPTVEAPEPDVPDDAKSKKFSKKLIETPMKHFRPVDQLSYNDLLFKGDNTWHAEGKVTLGFEDDACSESGTWTMDAASSETVAVVTWTVASTDCASRKPGSDTRAQITLKSGGQYQFQFR